MESKDIEQYLKDIFTSNGHSVKSIAVHTGSGGKAMIDKAVQDAFKLMTITLETTIKEKELEDARKIIYED